MLGEIWGSLRVERRCGSHRKRALTQTVTGIGMGIGCQSLLQLLHFAPGAIRLFNMVLSLESDAVTGYTEAAMVIVPSSELQAVAGGLKVISRRGRV